ncbi:MAG: alpha/beta hydrolase-fold protein [Rhodothermales bacterium]
MPSSRDILSRHAETLQGRLKLRWLQSRALGLRKSYYVYEPPGLDRHAALPAVYLFRGHEREWVNIGEDASRQHSTAIEDLDRAIAAGDLPPMLAVMPGLTSTNNHVPSLGVDMVGPMAGRPEGLGEGRFWRYLNDELFSRIGCDYPQTSGGIRLAAGFSLGGYTVSLLAIHRPGFFAHAAMYDALFMWPGHRDPREDGKGLTDPIWRDSPLFDAALGSPRDADALRRWNPTDTLKRADEQRLRELGKTTFWIASAGADGQQGNRDRTRFFGRLVRNKGLRLGFDTLVFDSEARHDWHWTDRFLIRFLRGALVDGASHPG